MHLMDSNEKHGEKVKCKLQKNAPYSSKPIQGATPHLLDTAGDIRTNSLATFSYGLLHTNASVLADQQGLTYISSVQIQNAV